jgi:uncharacterized membrane protein YfcA
MTGWLLPAAVLAVAILYASVGHAGATGYIAVMGLLGLAPEVIRPTALVLNLVVAAIGTVQFVRAGHFRRDLFLPLGLASVPAAAIGGAWSLPTAAFEGVLGLVLAFSAVRIVSEVLGIRAAAGLTSEHPTAVGRLSMPLLAAIGAGLGLASGLTGTGGGVFLTPLLLALGVATTRQVAAVSVVFIFVNSAAGLGGWLAGGRSLAAIDPWVVAAAAAGGLVGSQLGAFKLPVRWLRLLMAVVLAVASVKLLGESVAAGVWLGRRSRAADFVSPNDRPRVAAIGTGSRWYQKATGIDGAYGAAPSVRQFSDYIAVSDVDAQRMERAAAIVRDVYCEKPMTLTIAEGY